MKNINVFEEFCEVGIVCEFVRISLVYEMCKGI